jgi:hypothetical protein
LLARGANILLAASALAWVSSVFANISNPAIARVAGGVTRGETYDPVILREVVTANFEIARRLCNARDLRQLLILQIGVADVSIRATDLRQADADVATTETMAKALLACAPTESIGWLGLYWSDIRQNGFGPKTAAILDQSYRLAPHEAWIQLIRAPLALRSFNALAPELQEAVVQDFRDIFHSQLYPNAAGLFKTATAGVQARLLDATCTSGENERAAFRYFVEEAGLTIHHRCYPVKAR